MSAQLAHAVAKLVHALRQHFPFRGDPGAEEPRCHPMLPRQTFARLLVDLPEEEAPDQALLTGRVLTAGSREISGIVGPLREVYRLLREAAPSPRLQHLGMLFNDLLESRAYVCFVLTTAGSLRKPVAPVEPGERVMGYVYPLNPALVDDLRLAGHAVLTPEPHKPRLLIDLETLSVVLDGARVQVPNPKALSLYKALADSLGQPLTRSELRDKVKGVRGDKTIRNLLNSLPPRLGRTVKSGPEGYWLALPLPCEKEIHG
jgi:hypothetical protein